MSFEVTNESRALFVSLLAKGNSLHRASEKARIPVVWAKPIAEEHGWPDLGRLADESDRLHGRSEPAVEVPQNMPQQPLEGACEAPAAQPGMEDLADRLERLTNHRDPTVAAAARMVVADLERLFDALRDSPRSADQPMSRPNVKRQAYVMEVLADVDAGMSWQEVAASRGVTLDAIRKRFDRAGVEVPNLRQLADRENHMRRSAA